MSTTVSPCPNRKTWDATVRVTGGHPQQLWGIGEAQVSAEGPGLRVDRVMVHDAEQRTVGYAQLCLRSEAERVVAGTVHCHVHRPEDLPVVAAALADWAREEHSAVLLRFQPDTLRVPGAEEALEATGFARPAAGAGPAEPRRLEVLLGETERDLSRRLSEATLDRCRTALRTPGVTVREVTAGSRVLANIGLRTRLITQLLEDLGDHGVPCAMVTMSEGPLAGLVADALPGGTFRFRVTGDMVRRGKPHPEPYLLALDRLGAHVSGVDPRRVVAIEDSAPGVASASASGAATIAVPHFLPLPSSEDWALWPTLHGVTAPSLDAFVRSRNGGAGGGPVEFP